MENLNQFIVEKKKRPIKILQFGDGNFLRAFVEWVLQCANDQGFINTNVAVVRPLERGKVKVSDLKQQDGLYTLYLQGMQQGEMISQKSVIDVLGDFINPYTEYEGYLKYAESEELRFIISNTTEAGIVLDSKDTVLDQCPNSFPGKLLALLFRRYKHFRGDYSKGLILLPCELIDHNGAELKKVLNELAAINHLDSEFLNWLNEANTFCDTLVDRIVPGYPKDEIEQRTKELGYIDYFVVKGEVFHLWVIQAGDEVAKEFPVNRANLNILFVEDLAPYKERKVRILNGAHTALVPVAYLYGIDTVKEAVEDPIVGTFLQHIIFQEIIPTLNLPQNELDQFAKDVLERFKNPFIRHELLSIALNATTKYKTRNLPSVLQYIEKKGSLPKGLIFSLAALLVFFKGKRGEQDILLQDNPEFLELYKKLWAKYDGSYTSVKKLVEEFLGLKSHWGVDLNTIEGFKGAVSENVYAILSEGMETSLKRVIS
ncbi:MAG TPA: tagaturonate reductase [Clostridia bacterium]|nr:tagaturonate reductase [Clostridia bacterium]